MIIIKIYSPSYSYYIPSLVGKCKVFPYCAFFGIFIQQRQSICHCACVVSILSKLIGGVNLHMYISTFHAYSIIHLTCIMYL